MEKQHVEFNVATLNVLAEFLHNKGFKGNPPISGSDRLDAVAEAIRGMDPDVLCIQECDQAVLGALRTLGRIFVNIGYECVEADEDTKIDGFVNAIIVRDAEVLDFGCINIDDGGPRTCIWVEVSTPAGPRAILCTHLPIRGGGAARLAALRQIVMFADEKFGFGFYFIFGDGNLFKDCPMTEEIKAWLATLSFTNATEGHVTFCGMDYEPEQFRGLGDTNLDIALIPQQLEIQSVNVEFLRKGDVLLSDHACVRVSIVLEST